jgi:hypothetical protein
MPRKTKTKTIFEQLNDAQKRRLWRLANGHKLGNGRPPVLPVTLGLVDPGWSKLTAIGKRVAALCPAA